MILAGHETQQKYYRLLKRAVARTDIEMIAISYNKLRFLVGESRAGVIARLIEANRKARHDASFMEAMPDSYFSFCVLTTSKNPYRLWSAIQRNRWLVKRYHSGLRDQLRAGRKIRKQDEAPEVLTVDGADSSLVGVV